MEKSVLAAWADAQVAVNDQAAASVVTVATGRGHSVAGIVWGPNVVVTAAEPIAAGAALTIQYGNEDAIAAERRAVDLTTDVAILRAATSGRVAVLGDSASLRGGQPVLVAGRNRHGALSRWATIAQVGPAWHSRRGGVVERALRLSPGLDAELEGGGVFDIDGRLCAMAVRGPRGRVLGISVETIARVAGSVERHGYLPQPYLGLMLQPVMLDEPTRAAGVVQPRALMVVGVDPASPAADAGVRLGDIMLALDDAPLEDPRTVNRALIAGGVGHPMRFGLLRGGERKDLNMQAGERPRR